MIKVQLENVNSYKSNQKTKIQFENENKRPFKNQLYRKVHKDGEMVDLKNENPIRKFK